MEPLVAAGLIGLGLLAGAISGAMGVGGGIIMVPGLVLGAGMRFGEAVAASLLVMVAAAPMAIWRHARAGNVRVRPGIILGASGFVGVLAAAVVEPYLPQRLLEAAFGVLMVIAARQMAYARRPRSSGSSLWILVGVGVGAGAVAKLFGIGGGIVMVPAQVLLGTSMHVAVATSLVAVWTNAVVATGINLVGAGQWWIVSIWMAFGSAAGSWLGAHAAVRTAARALRRWFAVGLVAGALAMVARASV